MEEYPPKASLQEDVYRPFPALPAGSTNSNPPVDDPAGLVQEALTSLSSALQDGATERVQACFLAQQSYWRDVLAFTWHLRTLYDRPRIAPALAELAQARGLVGDSFRLDHQSVHEVRAGPELRWVEGLFTFETQSPAAKCGGRVILFPQEAATASSAESGGSVEWKIWTLSTWVDDLVASPQDVVGATQTPSRRLEDEGDAFETDVLILGGGNS